MKFLYMHFYVIYNSYYKHGNFKADVPNISVFGILFFTYWSIINSVIIIGKIAFNPYRNDLMPSKYTSIPLSILLVFALFFRKEKQCKIYNRYKSNDKLNTKRAKFIAFTLTIVAMLSTFIVLLIRNVALGRRTISEKGFFSSIQSIFDLV